MIEKLSNQDNIKYNSSLSLKTNNILEKEFDQWAALKWKKYPSLLKNYNQEIKAIEEEFNNYLKKLQWNVVAQLKECKSRKDVEPAVKQEKIAKVETNQHITFLSTKEAIKVATNVYRWWPMIHMIQWSKVPKLANENITYNKEYIFVHWAGNESESSLIYQWSQSWDFAFSIARNGAIFCYGDPRNFAWAIGRNWAFRGDLLANKKWIAIELSGKSYINQATGNHEVQSPTIEQQQSAARLVTQLKQKYIIWSDNVWTSAQAVTHNGKIMIWSHTDTHSRSRKILWAMWVNIHATRDIA